MEFIKIWSQIKKYEVHEKYGVDKNMDLIIYKFGVNENLKLMKNMETKVIL